MPTAAANGIDLYWEEFGAADDPPVVVISGLGSQCLSWREGLCARIAERGLRVIRFDNRDVGLSTWFDHLGDPLPALLAVAGGDHDRAPYRLSDMAADVAGLLDALDIGSAHVVGSSMGGMIAQQFAIDHPTRARSLTSIMSTTGEAHLPDPEDEAMAVLTTPAPTEREAFVEHEIAASRVLCSPAHFDEDEWRAYHGAVFDRALHPQGSARHLTAIQASGDRAAGLRGLDLPATVVHGRVDPLVKVEAGRRTAELIDGAELVLLDDMAHDLPAPLWDAYVDAIAATADRALEPTS